MNSRTNQDNCAIKCPCGAVVTNLVQHTRSLHHMRFVNAKRKPNCEELKQCECGALVFRMKDHLKSKIHKRYANKARKYKQCICGAIVLKLNVHLKSYAHWQSIDNENALKSIDLLLRLPCVERRSFSDIEHMLLGPL